jgi:hypothetical protein
MFYRLRHLQAWLFEAIAALVREDTAPSAGTVQRSAAAEARAAHMFAQARYENSNLELDWLWYAANMTSDAERRYCLERARAINPESEMVKQALAKLPPSTVSDEAILFARHIDRAA